jgi:sec-independent protein translocase protein TatB
MFDIGFSELVLVAVVGLLILGPERLPGAIRTGSLWLGRPRRSFNNIRAEIEREINADEIRQDLHNEGVMESLKQAEQDLRGGLEAVDEAVDEAASIGTLGDEKTINDTDKP